MICEYYNPKIEALLCRSRLTSDWISKGHLKDPFWRLYWHPSTAAALSCGSRNYQLGPDTLALIPPDTDFKPKMDCAFEQFYVHFRAGRPFDKFQRGLIALPADAAALSLIKSIQALLKDEECRPSRKLSMLIQSLCGLILGRLDPRLYEMDQGSSKIVAACEHMDAKFGDKISNCDLAKTAGMNINAFIKLFKRETGATPQRHLQERRIREACVMLRFGDMSIDEIAQETGFVDRSHLSRVFKALRGKSPAEYRKSLN